MRERGKSTRHNMMLMLVALLLVISLIGGTMAWLTISDRLSNTFTVTVGKVEEPGTPGDKDNNGDSEVDPPYEQVEGEGSLDGHIYEPNFVNDTELALGKTIKKDPYIGIGKGSEKSYIFAWWDDNTMYYANQDAAEQDTKSEGAFNITANTAEENNGKWGKVESTNASADGKSALYVWCDKNGDPMAVEVDNTSAWTGVLFKDGKITVKTDIYSLIETGGEVKNTVDVYCFIHQAEDSEGTSLEETAIGAAKTAWTKNNDTE